MKNFVSRRKAYYLIAIFVLSCAAVVMASSTIKMNLAELANRSGQIFAGKCVSVEEGFVTGPSGRQIPVTIYSFAVSQSIKGTAGGTITIRHFGHHKSRVVGTKALTIDGMPTYTVGQEYVLLLTAESKLGLTAPVGLAQGSFRVYVDPKSGKKSIVNGHENAGLFSQMDSKPQLSAKLNAEERNLLTRKSGAIAYTSFISLLEKLAR